MATCSASVPMYDADMFSDDGIASPYEHYRAIRALGPVVALPAQDLLAVGRYADVKGILLDHRHFVSGQGVALNQTVNTMSRGTTLASDAPAHMTLRGVIGAPLLPPAVEELRQQIEAAAESLIGRLAAAGSFDGVVDLARFLPVSIVSNLVGLPEDGRENMLDWAAATFDCMGPANARCLDAMPMMSEMIAYTMQQAGPNQVKPDSWAARIYAAADAGLVQHEQVPALLLDYLGPSLDTTIFATGHMLDQLGRDPQQWERLKLDPLLISNAIDETVRYESPIRSFTRVTTQDCEVAGVAVAAGRRLLVIYASANRDEAKWDDPDRFDIGRPDAREHLGFGKGRHVCAGQHLARLEMTSLLKAMLRHFPAFTVGAPTIQPNNLLRGFANLPVMVRKGNS